MIPANEGLQISQETANGINVTPGQSDVEDLQDRANPSHNTIIDQTRWSELTKGDFSRRIFRFRGEIKI